MSVRDFLDPDISEADGIAVILEGDGAFVGVFCVFRGGVGAGPAGSTGEFHIVMDEDAVMDDGETRLAGDFSGG